MSQNVFLLKEWLCVDEVELQADYWQEWDGSNKPRTGHFN